MRKSFLSSLLLLMIALTAAESFGANWYVAKGASGANNGTSWTNAWNEMNQINFSSVACGDTIWLAGGTYTTSLSLGKTCTSGNVLTLNRVLSTDSVAVAAAGWNSSFDNQVVIQNASINITGGAYYTVNGRVGTVSGNNFGIAVHWTSGNSALGVQDTDVSNISDVTFHYVELYGPPCVTSATCSQSDGLNLASYYYTLDTIMFDHGWIHRWAEAIRTSGDHNSTIQYTDIDTENTTSGEHADVLYSTGETNWTFRYNHVYTSPNDGIFFDGSSSGGPTNGLYMYGNVYYHSGGALVTFCCSSSAGPFTNIHITNNVFENDGTYGDYQPGWIYFEAGLGGSSVVENNVFESITFNGSPSPAVSDYNAFSSDIGKQDNGSHSFTYSKGGMFMNESPSNPSVADFTLTTAGATAFGKGLNLGAPYNVDMAGNACSSTCNIGAMQGGASQSQGPAPPSALTATVQ